MALVQHRCPDCNKLYDCLEPYPLCPHPVISHVGPEPMLVVCLECYVAAERQAAGRQCKRAGPRGEGP